MNKNNYLLIGFLFMCLTICINVEAKTVCKKATELHTKVCNQTSEWDGYYCDKVSYKKGDNVTFGSLREEDKLKSGDAFDCDVNGDGVYDSETERFYYVTDLDTDSNYAVLIYYSNVSGGKPTNTINYYYNEPSYSGDGIMFGPNTAKEQLPKTNQWTNVSLTNPIRNIFDENGGIQYANFNYEGAAARLLTYQEVVKACGEGNSKKSGYLEKCQYLMENTKYTDSSYTYGYWLETQNSNNNTSTRTGYYQQAFSLYGVHSDIEVFAAGKNITSPGVLAFTKYYGIRPAIEVLKSEIDNEEKIEENGENKPEESEKPKPSDKIKEIIKNPNTSTFIGIFGGLFVISGIAYVVLKLKKTKKIFK